MRNIALLAGIFVVPAIALWLGHHFRDRTARQRSTFWGLVIGYGLGLVVVSLVLMVDPVLWTDAQPVRTTLIYWGLLGSGVLGALVGRVRPLPASE